MRLCSRSFVPVPCSGSLFRFFCLCSGSFVPVPLFRFLCSSSFVQALWADVRDFWALSGSTWSIFGSQQEPYTYPLPPSVPHPPGGGPLA